MSVPGLADPSSPIRHAVVAGSHCHVSGQLAVAADGAFVAGTAAAEAELAFRNVFAVLDAAGFLPSDLVYVDIAFSYSCLSSRTSQRPLLVGPM